MPCPRHRRHAVLLAMSLSAIVASTSSVASAIRPPRPEGGGGVAAVPPPTVGRTKIGRDNAATRAKRARRADLTKIRGGDDEGSVKKTSMSASTFNLIKACVGSGVLALPAGVAAMGDVKSALIPASALVLGLGALSAYSFLMLGRVNDASPDVQSKTMGDMWKTEVGEGTAWLVTLSCFLTPLGAVLAFSIMLGDMVSSLAKTAGVKGIMATRQAAILTITALVLHPLCGLKSLAALAPVSMVAIFGVAATCVFMYLRMVGGAYSPGGTYFDTMPTDLQPSFGVIGTSKVWSPSILILVGMAATAYLVHFSALDFQTGLEDGTPARFATLVGMGFSATAIINVLFMAFGFLTFGGNCSGLVLNNYSTEDVGATLVRIVMVISMVGSYPIFMRAIKSAWFDLTSASNDGDGGEEVSEKRSKLATNAFLVAVTAVSLIIENAGFMVGFTGATMGSAIIYIFPPILFLASTSRRIESEELENTAAVRLERTFCRFLVVLGALVGVLGGIVSVLDSFFPGVL